LNAGLEVVPARTAIQARNPGMTPSVNIDDLKVGMFVHLDLGWWAHPFALSSFLITSPEQIATIRGLGLKRLRWSPEKSQLDDLAAPAGAAQADHAQPDPASAAAIAIANAAGDLGPADPPDHGPHAGEPVIGAGGPAGVTSAASTASAAAGHSPGTADAADPAGIARARHRARLAAQRQAERLCQSQVAEARAAWQQAGQCLEAAPHQARQIAEGLARAVTDKLMTPDELCVRVLTDEGGEAQARHALNVMIVSLMVGRVCSLAEAEMQDLGLGALLHDIGKLGLPPRHRQPFHGASADDAAAYQSHVMLGVAQGKRMGLPASVLQLLAQHHELADGSGFPQKLPAASQSRGARILALVNRYDNLCNPATPAPGMTPHEALAALFAQSRTKFDSAVLQSFIRMMGVYPPGSVVQLTDERFATVVSVNSARPLKPRVLVADLSVPPEEALLVDLDTRPDLGIRRSLKPPQLPAPVRDYLDPAPRMVYYFEPALQVPADGDLALAA